MRLEPREFEMKFDSCTEPWPADRLTLTVGNGESQWLAATPEREAASELLAALKGLGGPYPGGSLCFCEMRIDNPMYREHSPQCLAARAAIAKAEPS
jgi:hypothetical protein